MRIRLFEDSLSDDQRDYLNFVFFESNIQLDYISMPFLRSVHKLQKLNKAEILYRDISVLKFRPLIDARKWMTHGYAQFTMRKLNKCVLD